MTPHALARAECANFVKGACLGIPTGCLSGNVGAGPKPKCLLAEEPMQRCAYFEVAVLPLAGKASTKERPHRQEIYKQTRTAYWVEAKRAKSALDAPRTPAKGSPRDAT